MQHKIDHHKQIWLARFVVFFSFKFTSGNNTISYDVFTVSIDFAEAINSIFKWYAQLYQCRNKREKRSGPRLAHAMRLLTDYASHRQHHKNSQTWIMSFDSFSNQKTLPFCTLSIRRSITSDNRPEKKQTAAKSIAPRKIDCAKENRRICSFAFCLCRIDCVCVESCRHGEKENVANTYRC